ncbi:MAG: hypothetical protein K9L18_16660 [Desulfarculaceae bacterium]|nr:hypothetical protein [Desulfarculaceae bacterium]
MKTTNAIHLKNAAKLSNRWGPPLSRIDQHHLEVNIKKRTIGMDPEEKIELVIVVSQEGHEKILSLAETRGVSLEQMVEEWVEIGAAATEFAVFKKKGTH